MGHEKGGRGDSLIVGDATVILRKFLREAGDERVITFEQRQEVRRKLQDYNPQTDEDRDLVRTNALRPQFEALQKRHAVLIRALGSHLRAINPKGHPGRSTNWHFAPDLIPSTEVFKTVSDKYKSSVVSLTVEQYALNGALVNKGTFLRTLVGMQSHMQVDELLQELLKLPTPLLEELGLPREVHYEFGKLTHRYAYYPSLKEFGEATGLLPVAPHIRADGSMQGT